MEEWIFPIAAVKALQQASLTAGGWRRVTESERAGGGVCSGVCAQATEHATTDNMSQLQSQEAERPKEDKGWS